LDNLVVLNEKAGRDSGDRAIAAAARTLANRAKAERWTFGRVGGDEFALVAPGLSLEAAFLRAERVRAEVVAALHKAVSGKYGTTATIGVANAPRDAKTAAAHAQGRSRSLRGEGARGQHRWPAAGRGHGAALLLLLPRTARPPPLARRPPQEEGGGPPPRGARRSSAKVRAHVGHGADARAPC